MTTGEKAAVAIVSVVVLGGVAGLVLYSTRDDGGRPRDTGAGNPFLQGEGLSGAGSRNPAPAGRFGPVASSIAFGGRISGVGPNTKPPSLSPPPKPRYTAGGGLV